MNIYFYNATVTSIYDGDTIRADIDLGFNIRMANEALRLTGINTPEIKGEEREQGLLSKEYVMSKIPPGTRIQVLTEKDTKGKYGRYLATIYYYDVDGTLANLNEELVKMGLAEAVDY